jgi:hypothetical protein
MSSPYPSLQTRELPVPEIWDISPPAELQAALETCFKPLQTTYPGMLRFGKTKKQTNFLRFDHKWHLEAFKGDVPFRSGSFFGKARQYTGGNPTNELIDISGFCKITHLLDAYRMIQGSYPVAQHPALPSPGRKSAKVYAKLHDPHNQAYVDAVACYILSKFREADHSPHFSLFYGSYLAIAKDYYYNITEEFNDLRFEGWFWRKHAQGQFKLAGFTGDVLIDPSNNLLCPPDDISDFSSETSSDGTTRSSDTSELYDFHENNEDSASLHSATIKTASSESESTKESGSSFSDISDGFDENTKIFASLAEFPTMLIFLESNRETMDFLLDNPAEVGAVHGTDEWECRWSAWLFQVIAALCQIQSLWAMTHNDLHSNNILWTPTDKAFLYYKALDGRQFKVPTYGKIFRIIDFGRAIYTHNGTLCISDDYWPDNEAGSQYNFGPLYDPSKPRIYPNPSFDLSRLSVSILEALFKDIPEDREHGRVLSDEPGITQMETVSDLYNVLWEWLIDENGKNVLWDEDHTERYPGFDLYTVIAQKVKGAVPCEQLNRAPFSGFLMPKSATVPEGEKTYSLFC